MSFSLWFFVLKFCVLVCCLVYRRVSWKYVQLSVWVILLSLCLCIVVAWTQLLAVEMVQCFPFCVDVKDRKSVV